MEKNQIDKEQKIIDLERKCTIHKENKHKIRTWFYRMLVKHYEKTK